MCQLILQLSTKLLGGNQVHLVIVLTTRQVVALQSLKTVVVKHMEGFVGDRRAELLQIFDGRLGGRVQELLKLIDSLKPAATKR